MHYLEARGRGVSLRAAPIEVSRIVRTRIIGDRAATVLTSATLAVEGGFDYVKTRLGPGRRRDAAAAVGVRFRAPGRAVSAGRDAGPAVAGVQLARRRGSIGELLDRTRGRAFVLFTSYAAMRDVHAHIEQRVSWPLFVQGTAPRTSLLRDFRATPNAVLLATAELLAGRGRRRRGAELRHHRSAAVRVTGDPLVSARIKAIADRGGQPFHEYQVPLATLTLLQGLGRLIRTKTDRGVLAILDPRLTRMSYGRRFLESFPPAPITDDLGRDGRRRFF